MEFNGWNSFEDLARACGYTNCHNASDNTSETCNNNVTNPFCTSTSTNATQNNNSSKNKEKSSNSDYNIKLSSDNNVDKIDALEFRINQLTAEMERIKNKIGN